MSDTQDTTQFGALGQPPLPDRREVVPSSYGPATPVPPAGRPPQGPLPPLGYAGYPAFPPPPPPKKSNTGWWVALIVLVVFGLGGMMLVGFIGVLSGAGGAQAGGQRKLREIVVEGSGDDKIALIDLHGVIMDVPSGGLFGGGPSIVQSVIKQVRQAAEDPDVQGILLSVDSPGGGVTASDEICHEIKKAKEAGKVIVVHCGDLCASGGYYVAAPADAIVASPTCITGSIGVIIGHMNMQELFEQKLGIKDRPIKSGPHKDILSSGREMTAEELAIIQSVVDAMYDRFVTIVATGRAGRGPIPVGLEEAKAAVRKVADGRIFTGEQALDLGLVDKVGYLEDALAETLQRAGLTQASVVRYRSDPTLMEVLAGEARGPKVEINTGVQIDARGFLEQATPRFEYRWSPGR